MAQRLNALNGKQFNDERIIIRLESNGSVRLTNNPLLCKQTVKFKAA